MDENSGASAAAIQSAMQKVFGSDYEGMVIPFTRFIPLPPPAMEPMTKYFDFMDSLLGVQSGGRFLIQAASTIGAAAASTLGGVTISPMPPPKMLLRTKKLPRGL